MESQLILPEERRKEEYCFSQEHLRSIDLEDEEETDGADFARDENLELLRSLVEVIAERDRVVEY